MHLTHHVSQSQFIDDNESLDCAFFLYLLTRAEKAYQCIFMSAMIIQSRRGKAILSRP